MLVVFVARWHALHLVEDPFEVGPQVTPGMPVDGWSGSCPLARIASFHDPSPSRLLTVWARYSP